MTPLATRTVTARAPAKVNLALVVGPLRPDGFHDLATVFHAVDLYEQVNLSEGPPGIRVVVHGEGAEIVPTGPGNLAVAAVAAVAARAGVDLRRRGVDVVIAKRVPVAAGLAGGSADAAAALLAADRLWRARLGRTQLAALAANLGSDVPFSLHGGTALGTGRGEVLTPLPSTGSLHWVLAFGSGQLATPRVFAELDRMRARLPDPGGQSRPGVPSPLLAALRSGDLTALAAALSNDLEPAAIALAPLLHRCLDRGRAAGAMAAVVSGSGPTCAFLARDEAHAAGVAVELTDQGVCRAAVTVTGPVAGAAMTG